MAGLVGLGGAVTGGGYAWHGDPTAVAINTAITARIRSRIERRDLTWTWLARQMGVPDHWLSTRTQNRVRWSVADLYNAADVLGVPVIDLLPEL